MGIAHGAERGVMALVVSGLMIEQVGYGAGDEIMEMAYRGRGC